MKAKDITIIVPVFNVESFIEECLVSISNQTFSGDVECFVVDDCGTDSSIERVQSFIERYQGNISFEILHNDTNKGLSAARNLGIKYARGEYLYFLDGDDKLYPESLQLLWELREKYNQVDVVKGDFVIEGLSKSILNKSFPQFTDDVDWIRTNFCNFTIPESACNCLVKKDLVVDNFVFFREGWIQEDTMWAFELQRHIKSIAFCFEATYFYRSNNGSIMHTMNKEKEANAYAMIFNEAYGMMRNKKVERFELRYLELIAQRIYEALGNDGMRKILTYNNQFFKVLFKCNNKLRYQNRGLRGWLMWKFVMLFRYILCRRRVFNYNVL